MDFKFEIHFSHSSNRNTIQTYSGDVAADAMMLQRAEAEASYEILSRSSLRLLLIVRPAHGGVRGESEGK